MKRKELRVVTETNSDNVLEMPFRKRGEKGSRFIQGSPTDLNAWRIVILAVFGLFAPVVQEAFFNDLRLFGVKPNIAMVFVFTFAVVMNERSAIVVGACEGMYVDIIFGKTLGVFGLLFTILAYAASNIPFRKFKTVHVLSLTAAPVFFTVYTFAESLLCRLTHMLARTGTSHVYFSDFGKHILVRILPVSLYDLIIFAIIFLPLRMLWKVAVLKRNKKPEFSGRMEENE